MGKNVRFSYILFGFMGSPVYQYTKFHASMRPGSALDHISHGVRGPWLRPWTEILDFRIFYSTFGTAVTSIPNFMLLQYREVIYTIFRTASGALSSAPGLKLFFLPFLWFRDNKHYQCANFQLPRPCGSA